MYNNYDALIIGSGINGIAAAIYLQQKGLKTAIYEQAAIAGGSTRTSELTLPGFKHDIGSSIHPMAHASPFLRTLPLEKHGLEWIFPDIPFSHPFTDGTAFACYQDLEKTAAQLGEDQESYINLISPILQDWDKLENNLLAPLNFPSNLLEFLKFGIKAMPPAKTLADFYFKTEKAKLLFYGAAGHSILPLTNLASSSFGLVLTLMAHKNGWPFPKGGAQNYTNALISYYKSIGGELNLNFNVFDINQLPNAKSYLFDLTPARFLAIEGLNLTDSYRNKMASYNYGAGVFKMDFALNAPIPFLDEKCQKSGTVHLGFSTDEMENSEKFAYQNRKTANPYVLLAQHSVFDDTRAPQGKHTAWAYCHVPNGSTQDYSNAIENQIERAAPGFKDCIIAKHTMNTVELGQFNPNIIGGDINGGKQDITQLFTRPIARLSPYSTPDPRVYICSSSTPPGGGVHGMCGYHAAKKVIKDHFMELD